MTDEGPRLPRALTVVYGFVVVTAFGSWFYGYGVLVEPIAQDTGWSESWLTSAYGVGLFAVGVAGVFVGRLIDRVGPRPAFLLGAAGGAGGTALTATATSPLVFVAAAVATQACIGSVGYYTAVHATIARLAPEDRTRAITVNTLWGAFASPVFLPLLAAATNWDGWRTAVSVGSGLAVAAFVVAALLSPSGRSAAVAAGGSRTMLADLVDAVRDPVVRRLLLVGLVGGMAFSVLLLYQVPAMVSAGLTLGLASSLAGLRGLIQLAGRIPLPWLVARLGARRFFQISFALVGVSALLLPVSGTVAVALLFAAVAGFAVGAFSTMESIYVAEMVPVASVGMALGAYSLMRGVGAALGPTGAGLLTEAVDSRGPALVIVAALALWGTFLIPAGRRNPA